MKPRMSYTEATKLLGWSVPPVFGEQTKQDIIDAAIELSENGTKPIDTQVANLWRAQLDEFG